MKKIMSPLRAMPANTYERMMEEYSKEAIMSVLLAISINM